MICRISGHVCDVCCRDAVLLENSCDKLKRVDSNGRHTDQYRYDLFHPELENWPVFFIRHDNRFANVSLHTFLYCPNSAMKHTKGDLYKSRSKVVHSDTASRGDSPLLELSLESGRRFAFCTCFVDLGNVLCSKLDVAYREV
jgi:hypothetical protein